MGRKKKPSSIVHWVTVRHVETGLLVDTYAFTDLAAAKSKKIDQEKIQAAKHLRTRVAIESLDSERFYCPPGVKRH